MATPTLQVALDLLEIDRAVEIAEEAVRGGADWIEAGTPLIKSEGMQAVRTLRKAFPGHEIVADMKVADTGAVEVEMAAKSGAGIVCILGDADDTVIAEAVRSARKYGVRIMADLINVQDPVSRSRELEALGVDYINAHVGIDQQMIGESSLDLLRRLAGEVSIPIAVAGGLDAETASEAVAAGASIVIVGGNIVKAADVTGAARRVREAIDRPEIRPREEESPEAAIRRLLEAVSAPNVTDAMHRKGAMIDIVSICGRVKAVGRAVTVRTIAGDWAKPVEAINVAGRGTSSSSATTAGRTSPPGGNLPPTPPGTGGLWGS
jgi:3-hexulose-6-phosphate synthase/6-phospho-3-hexuloisomerase